MAYSLPAVIFDLAECKKIAGDASLYAVNNDPDSLAAQISNLIEAPSLCATMGETGRRRLEAHYAWDQQKQVYLDVFRSLIDE